MDKAAKALRVQMQRFPAMPTRRAYGCTIIPVSR
jgi:hypothetical protein